jgi:hypothetical protein
LVKSLSTAIIRIALLAGTLALAACASGTSTGGTSSDGGAPSAPTATPKSKPTALPKITLALCQSILTLAEANQIMQPATPATSIRIDAPKSGNGSCNYEYAPYKAVVSVVFVATIPPSAQGQPIAGHIPNMPGIVINTAVSGVGDQAQYVAASTKVGAGTYNFDALDVMYGAIFFDCNHAYLGASRAAAEQAPLTQVCKLVVSRL